MEYLESGIIFIVFKRNLIVFHLTVVIWCRACIAVDDRLFVIGGQEGDFMAKPGSPIFKCSRRHEVSFSLSVNIKHDLKRKYYNLVVVF